MKSPINKSLFIIILSLLFLDFSSILYCQQSNPKAVKLIGTWEYQTQNSTITLKIMDNNHLVFDGEETTYSLIPNAIRVPDDYGGFFDYYYILADEKLSISFPDGYQYAFSKVKTSTTNNNSNHQTVTKSLFGRLCSYSSSSGYSSSYSTSKSIYFDGYGNFKTGSESSYSGNGDGYANSSNNNNIGKYSVSGNTVTLYYNDGNKYTLNVYFRQSSGEITELQYKKDIYAKSLCD